MEAQELRRAANNQLQQTALARHRASERRGLPSACCRTAGFVRPQQIRLVIVEE